MSDEVNEVTQADRDAAADIWKNYIARVGEIMAEKAIREGASDDTMIVQAFARHRTAASQASAGEGLRVLKGWLDWYRFATGDDDCQYLNDKGWDDAEALASTTMGVLAALTTPEGLRLADELSDEGAERHG